MNPFRLEMEWKDECCCMCQFQVQDPTMSVLVQNERKVNNPKCFCFFLPCISDYNVVFVLEVEKYCCDWIFFPFFFSFWISIPFQFFFMIVMSLLFTCIVVPVVLL